LITPNKHVNVTECALGPLNSRDIFSMTGAICGTGSTKN
jgi:hypothetical protein